MKRMTLIWSRMWHYYLDHPKVIFGYLNLILTFILIFFLLDRMLYISSLKNDIQVLEYRVDSYKEMNQKLTDIIKQGDSPSYLEKGD